METNTNNNYSLVSQLFSSVTRPLRREAKKALKDHDKKTSLIAEKHFNALKLSVDLKISQS